MKSRRKPDLLLILAIFVFIGVVVSTLVQSKHTASTKPGNSTAAPIKMLNQQATEIYQGNFQLVSRRTYGQ